MQQCRRNEWLELKNGGAEHIAMTMTIHNDISNGRDILYNSTVVVGGAS